MGEVVQLKSNEQLFDEHRKALVDLVCCFAIHSADGMYLDELIAAEDEFVRTYQAVRE